MRKLIRLLLLPVAFVSVASLLGLAHTPSAEDKKRLQPLLE